jgi:hypothetical protein
MEVKYYKAKAVSPQPSKTELLTAQAVYHLVYFRLLFFAQFFINLIYFRLFYKSFGLYFDLCKNLFKV